MAKLFSQPTYQALDANGDAISGARLFFYLTGTSTKHDTYTDNALSVAHANPVVADSAGRFAPIYLQDADYKAVLAIAGADDPPTTPVQTIDPVHGAEAVDPADLDADNVFTKTTTWRHGADVASATSLVLGDGNIFDITGTTTITSIGAKGVGTIIVLQFDDALTLTHSATDLVLPGGLDITTAAGDVAILEEYAAGDWRLVNYQSGSGIAPLPRGYVDGLILSNNTTDAAKDIDIAAGTARDDSDTANLTLSATLVKQLDAAWAVGTNQGGLDGTESVPGTPDADTWYHAWSIRRSDTGVTDVIFSESATAPTMPTDYDQKQWIGAVLFDATPDILAFIQNDNDFWWVDRVTDFSSATPGTSAVLEVMSVPTGRKVMWHGAHTMVTGTSSSLISSPDQTDQTPTASLNDASVSGGVTESGANLSRLTDTSGRIRRRATANVASYIIDTLGWSYQRGKNA